MAPPYGVQLFIPILLLRTLRFPEIRTCEMTDELGWVILQTATTGLHHSFIHYSV